MSLLVAKESLRLEKWLPGLTAGLVLGILIVVIEISLAALIFSGPLTPFLGRGIGLTLYGTLAISLVTALWSSFPAAISVCQDSPVAILAVMAAAMVGAAGGVADEGLFATVVAGIAISSLATGVFFVLLGWFRLGNLVRYIPYPVVGGFLAATGWLLVGGAMGMMTNRPFVLSQLAEWLAGEMLVRWIPGVAFALILLWLLRRYRHFLIVPGVILGSVVLFYGVMAVVGLSPVEASEAGWLLGPFPQGALWRPITGATLGMVDWPAVLAQAGSIGTVMIMAMVSLLLNASGLEVASGQAVDLNWELRVAGGGNLLAGLGGGPAGYHALSLSVMGPRLGANSRLVGGTTALLLGVMLFLGAAVLAYFPRPVAGGMILFLGLSFLVDWLYDGWGRLSRTDYGVVVLIVAAVHFLGVLRGVGLGIVVAVVLFIVEYARIPVIKHALWGSSFPSNVARPLWQRQLLQRHGERLMILGLQGFLFFGTADRLVNEVEERLAAAALKVGTVCYLLLDFRQVLGMDGSAVLSFVRLRQLAEKRPMVLVLTNLTPKMVRQLTPDVLGEEAGVCRHLPDLDHGVEWCEEAILREVASMEGEGLTAGRGDGLAAFLDGRGNSVAGYVEQLAVDAGSYLIRQGQAATGIYFVVQGQVKVELEQADGLPLRIRLFGPGSIVGEMSLYSNEVASASVVASRPTVVEYVSSSALARMEVDDPELAAEFHKFMAQLLVEKLQRATVTMEALLK